MCFGSARVMPDILHDTEPLRESGHHRTATEGLSTLYDRVDPTLTRRHGNAQHILACHADPLRTDSDAGRESLADRALYASCVGRPERCYVRRPRRPKLLAERAFGPKYLQGVRH